MTDRAISEVIGYALVFSLVLSTVALVSVAGFGQLQQTRDAEQVNNAQRAFDLLATNMDDIAQRGAPSRSTEIRLKESQLDVASPIQVTIVAQNSSNVDQNRTNTYDVNPIIYKTNDGDSQLVYAGGAIFRIDNGNGVALERPSIVAESDRVVFPLVQTRSRNVQGVAGGTIRVRADNSGTELLVSDTKGTFDTMLLNVTSPRANLWVDVLDEYEAFDCDLDTSGSTDQAECEATGLDRTHFTAVRVDLSLAL